ncbi:MAG: hypothetical protein IH851_06025 [Armatimonadetes bacterium]|nr:hypothetical protein [Armatimonadota bacterium]
MKKHSHSRGSASLIILFVMMVLVLMMYALAAFSTTSMSRSERELSAAQAYHAAQAAVESEHQELIVSVGWENGLFTYYERNIQDIPTTLPDGTTGSIEVLPFGDGKQAWLTSVAVVNGLARSVRVQLIKKKASLWENAATAGAGSGGATISGNVDIRGSLHMMGDGDPYTDLNGNGVWDLGEPYNDVNSDGAYDPPLAVTDVIAAFAGGAYVGNNYDDIPAALAAMIPSIPTQNGLKTLGAEVRAKHGTIEINGSATVGLPGNIGDQKGMVDATYVSDGWSGFKGADSVFSDNGTSGQYDLGDGVKFPLITGVGAEEYTDASTGITYADHKAYLDAVSLTVPISEIHMDTEAFAYGPDANGNSIQWIPPADGADTGRLLVEGIVRIDGDLDIGEHNLIIVYGNSGGPGDRGTLYATGSISVHSDLLPESGSIFPTDVALGMIAVRDINLATEPGDSHLTMVGAFYAQGTVRTAKQTDIAGSIMSSYFDLGIDVPSIYQVPGMVKNLPPGMPGDRQIATVIRMSWRERAASGGS